MCVGAAFDETFVFERDEGLRNRAAGRAQIVGERGGRAREPVGARKIAQRFPLRGIEAVCVAVSADDAGNPFQKVGGAQSLTRW
jgi:hypothetical protein